MPEAPAIPPIEDGELLYRRIAANTGWHTPGKSPAIKEAAFLPNRNDLTGISFSRERFSRPESIGVKPGQVYYAAVLRAADIRAMGLTLANDDECPPDDGSLKDPAHAQITELRISRLDTDETDDFVGQLGSRVIEVLGPFQVPDPAS